MCLLFMCLSVIVVGLVNLFVCSLFLVFVVVSFFGGRGAFAAGRAVAVASLPSGSVTRGGRVLGTSTKGQANALG